MRRLKFILSFLLVLTALTLSAQSVRLNVPTAGGQPGVGDLFYIYITLHDISAQPGQPASIPGAKVLYMQQRSSSTNVSIVNGVQTSSSETTYAMTCRAEQPGTYTYGPISVGGHRSNKVTYSIGKTSSNTRQDPSAPGNMPDPNAGPKLTKVGGNDLFLKATVSNPSPYEQQGVVYTVKLYTTYSQIFNWIATNSPSFGNCTYEASDDVSHSLGTESYNGKTYYSAVIARYIIYPTKSGQVKIVGNSYTGSVGRTYTYTDPYFGAMSKMEPVQVEARPNDITLNVRPLPNQSQYPDINGVGDFHVSASMLSKSFKAHQPAKMRFTITGTGNLSFVSLPDLASEFPPEVKFLKSEDKITKTVGSTDVNGTVTFDVTFIPQKEGDFQLPPIKFYFFNAAKGEWYVLSTQAFDLKIGEGSATHADDASVKFVDALQPLGKLAKTHTYFVSLPLFWLWYAVPVFLLILSVLIYRKRVARLSDIDMLRRRKAGKVARRRLKAAAACLRHKDFAHFYDEVLKGLWGYLGDKLNLPASDLNRDNVREALSAAGAQPQTLDNLIALIDDCEMAKYGSHTSANMQRDYMAACNVIDALETELRPASNPQKN